MVGILVESSLPSVPFLHPLFDAGQHFIIAQLHPWLADEETWWHLASKTLDDDVRVEPFGKVNDEVDILLKVEEMEMIRMLKVFLGHLGAFEDLQLVELDRSQGQLRNDVSGIKHHGFAFARQPEDEMRSTRNAIVGSHVDGTFRRDQKFFLFL